MSGSVHHPVVTTRKTPKRTRSESIELERTSNSQLGSGTFASVIRAVDKDLGREIAYKELHAKLIKNTKARDFFVYEGQIMAQLDHPNIVPVYEMGRCRSTDNLGRESIGRESLYLAMKRIQGRTLLDVIEEREPGPLEENELFSLLQSFLKVCDAVGFAHSRGVIHRDLKPSNIMLGDYGEVYVLDWGVAMTLKEMAKLPRGSDIMGTPAYMAPEQAKGFHDEVDERTDVYCLGGCLYELLTGHPPNVFKGSLIQSDPERTVAAEVPPLQERVPFTLPTQLCKLVMRALAINRADRYQNAMELKSDIEKFLRTYSFFPRVTFKEGELLFAEGDEGDSAYIIVNGVCEVFTTAGGKETHLSELGRGGVLGEIAVFTRRRRTASVRALTTVTAIRVTRDQILQDGELGYWVTFITRALAERFLEDERKIKDLEKRLRQFESL